MSKALETYQDAVRSGLHPETAKAFEPKPEPIMHPETEKAFEPAPESSLPMSKTEPEPIYSETTYTDSDPKLWVLIAMSAVTIGLLVYLIWFIEPAKTIEPQVLNPTPSVEEVKEKYFPPPKPKPKKAPIKRASIPVTRPVSPAPKTIIVYDRSLLNTLCYTYGNRDACKKIVRELPSRVSPLRRYQY